MSVAVIPLHPAAPVVLPKPAEKNRQCRYDAKRILEIIVTLLIFGTFFGFAVYGVLILMVPDFNCYRSEIPAVNQPVASYVPTGMKIDYDGPFRVIVTIDPDVDANGVADVDGDLSIVGNLHAYTHDRKMTLRFARLDSAYQASVRTENETTYNFGNKNPQSEDGGTFSDTVVRVRVNSLSEIINRSPLDVLVSSPLAMQEFRITSVGAGNIIVPNLAAADRLIIYQAGSGDVKVTGDCKMLLASMFDKGALDAGTLQAENADINLSSSGNAVVSVLYKIEVTLAGTGSVYYRGTPRLAVSNNGDGQIVRFEAN